MASAMPFFFVSGQICGKDAGVVGWAEILSLNKVEQ
jgi:hypothetical protein